ncbi:lipopolysaccharide biosynthesis protein [Peribacillus frigoritolerans]|uniref:lipopolysaccharide biosynthesis protein n=1 Tax=Peribacillus castrilensis TaxID=2897690 RepID=UPI00296F68E2|nr:lipopolysaccharide biosynthesis protein [Peribacillus castrilensis]
MDNSKLKGKIFKATKWATISELAVKIITPLTNLILARLLVPEAFGVVATITMIISFADMLTDAGFQKYLVQHEFKNNVDKHEKANVAFWTNLGISLLLLGIIILFCDPIAKLVGNPGLGNVIAISCLQLPLTSFSSIQMALYRRDFDFKTLFWVRLISTFIPFVVTIPLAIMDFSYWALIIGIICGNLFNAVILTIKSKWKPKFFYKVEILKEMLSFSLWSLIEAISIWLTAWIDIFIIGSFLSQFYSGIYMTSTTMVNSIMSLITASTIPILFSALSRLQNNEQQFKKTFLDMQRFVSIFVFPLGVGIYLYSDFATQIFLGDKWSEASKVIGTWALTSAIVIVFGNYCSEVYRAKGRPKLSFLAQILHLIVLIPVCVISGKYGFWELVFARSWIRMESILVHFLIMKFAFGFSILKIVKNVSPTIISAIVMGFFGYLLIQLDKSTLWNLLSIILCVVIYFGMLFLFPNIRREFWGILKKLKVREI